MRVQAFFDYNTATVSYIVIDPETNQCAILDSVMDYDPFSGRITSTSADQLIAYIKENKLSVQWILETHIHADHLTAASYLKEKLGGKIGISNKITEVLAYWVPLFNTQQDTPLDASQFDYLFNDGETFHVGKLAVKVIHTPGHTPACVSYQMEDAIFVGDALFMPYVGTARTDFPGGSPEQLYQSLQKILTLPDNTRIFTCHDYPPQGEAPKWESTVAEEKQKNVMVNAGIDERTFIANRKQRDTNKPVPKLLIPSLQYNLRAGSLGNAEKNRIHYIKIPINQF